ncbi:MAG: 16S rRNA (adenine(1518)-N(6)/adenine(1519)-N(6))-dimethyltransferase RsmA [bacterium]
MEKTHKAKKSLGQNFLKSEPALKKIIEAGEINKDDIILEIGPGKGALTKKLLEVAGCVIAVEKDRELFAFLQEKFSEEISIGKLILINEDILEIEIADKSFSDSPQKFSAENFLCPAPSRLPRVHSRTIYLPSNYKIIANIPYNITGAILKKFLTEKNQPSLMVLMVQHEVAKRIVARDGKQSILSISVKAYGNPKIEMKVPARYFSPAPKVDSAIISIKNISREFFTESTSPQPSPLKGEGVASTAQIKNSSSLEFEEKFWEIIHAGFAHKRKKLSSNLKKHIGPSSIELKNKRAEELSLTDWINILKY